jgi:transcriptional regulator with XRE-family HTH domain
MKAQEKLEKGKIKLRFATALDKLLTQSELANYKKLAEAAGMESAHVQRISVGELDVTVTTVVAIANALGLSFGEIASAYDLITPRDIENYLVVLAERKRRRGKKPKSASVRNSKRVGGK